jgi:hypothetical protein
MLINLPVRIKGKIKTFSILRLRTKFLYDQFVTIVFCLIRIKIIEYEYRSKGRLVSLS